MIRVKYVRYLERLKIMTARLKNLQNKLKVLMRCFRVNHLKYLISQLNVKNLTARYLNLKHSITRKEINIIRNLGRKKNLKSHLRGLRKKLLHLTKGLKPWKAKTH